MNLNCIDCQTNFTLTDGEVSFYKQKGFELPKRCKSCRAIKKQQRESGQEYWEKPAWLR